MAYVSDLLRAEHGEILTLGMGDSRSDGPFLALCDYAITPRHSQLSKRCFGEPARSACGHSWLHAV